MAVLWDLDLCIIITFTLISNGLCTNHLSKNTAVSHRSASLLKHIIADESEKYGIEPQKTLINDYTRRNKRNGITNERIDGELNGKHE